MSTTSTPARVPQIMKLWPLMLPLLLFLPGVAGFPYPGSGAPYSDLAVSHYPNAVFLTRTIIADHQIPLWSPTILSGYPFAANPLAGLWYPFGWPALIFPLPLGFNLVVMLHLLWGGVGMYRLLRVQGLEHSAALLGGLAFEALPKLFAHFGAGHLTLLYAVPWTPWLLLAQSEHTAGRWKRLRQPGVVLAVIFLADVRWAAYAGLLWLAWALAYSQRGWLTRLLDAAKQIGLAALLGAVLALPLWEYIQLSTRAALQPEDVFTFSLEPAQLLGLIFPAFNGDHESMLYTGALVIGLAVLAVLWRETRRSARFWVWAFLLTLLYSLGENIPGLIFLARLPGFSLLRVPPRALFLVGMALVVLAAYTLDHLLRVQPEGRPVFWARLVLAGLAGFGLVLAAAVWLVTGAFPGNFLWGGVGLLIVTFWVEARFSNWLLPRAWLAMAFVLLVVDLGVMDASLVDFRSKADVLAEGAAVADVISSGDGFRVYSPSYSIPQQTAAYYGLELADGVDPMQLETYAAYMEIATGVPRAGYSVTLPPFAGEEGDPATANRAYLPDACLLGQLNVAYVAAEYGLDVDGLELLDQFGETRLYANDYVLPRAYVSTQDGSSAAAEIVSRTPNQITLLATGPGRLVLAEIDYPGWGGTVDGQKTEIVLVEDLLRGVDLEAGMHTVEFRFRPLRVYLGLASSILTLLALLIVPRLRKAKGAV
ncbi:MAG: hypothetical protein JXB38_18890 [Anaerolineales bacterium]|nr:hypothetical protein [Anaerolineales bacterium]